jgi:hypothetical protein
LGGAEEERDGTKVNWLRRVLLQVPQYAVDGLRALVECGDPVSQDNLNCLSDSLLRRHLLDPMGACTHLVGMTTMARQLRLK